MTMPYDDDLEDAERLADEILGTPTTPTNETPADRAAPESRGANAPARAADASDAASQTAAMASEHEPSDAQHAEADAVPDDVMTSAVAFFRHWFAGCEGIVQLVAIMPDGGRVQTFNVEPPYDFTAAATWAREKSDAGFNVYVSPITQRAGATGRGSEATAFELPGVFADVDDLAPEMGFWPIIDATERVTAAVWSGKGLHVYGRFPKPIRVTDANRDQLRRLLYGYGAGLNAAVHGDGQRRVDRFDLASLLRVPGTINYPNAKKRNAGREPERTFLFALPGGTIRPEQLTEWLIAHPREAAGSPTAGEDGAEPRTVADAKPGELPPEWDDWLATDAILRARFDRMTPGPKQTDTSASGFLLSLFDHLARTYRDRITDAEALAVGVEFYRRAGDRPRPHAIRRTWDEAKTMKANDYDATDVGNARQFAKQHGERIRYVYPWKQWLIYDGTRWAPDTTGEVTRLAQATADAMLKAAVDFDGDPDERKRRIRDALKAKDDHRIRAMIAQAQPLCSARPEDFDSDPFLLNCENGTLDLRTGELRKHDPDDMLTKIASVPYDPDAKCPRWHVFLDRVFAGNTRLIDYAQRALGAALVGKMQEQCFHILYGTGANGKSTLIEVVRAVVGEYAMNAAATTFLNQRNPAAIRSDLARLKGARFVTASETNKGGALDEATIKALTGGDTITARRLYQGEEEFQPAAHLFLQTNHKPRIKGNDHAIWRRVRLIPFTVTIPPEEQDVNLGAKLREELPGIFAWMVEGAVAVQKAGGRLEPVPEVVEAVEKYRHEMDDVGQFLRAATVAGPGLTVGSRALYNAYEAWCEETGREPRKLGAFRAGVAERGYASEHHRAGTVWLELGLISQVRLRVRCPRCRASVETEPGRTRAMCCGSTPLLALGAILRLREAA